MNIANLMEQINSPLIVNKILSMNIKNIDKCNQLNKFIFRIDKDMLKELFKIKFRGYLEYVPFIKKEKDFIEDPLFLKIKEYYNWSDREIKEQLPLIRIVLADDKIRKEYYNFFGLIQ